MMKCRSVVGIWSETLPIHRVTTTAVLTQPPTLYTGGVDGSIVWWSFIGDEPNKVIKPIAMLCGHAAPIVGLGICYPLLSPKDGNIDHLGDASVNFSGGDNGALVSACTDGVLCIWSRGSGHCRRRRKLPPWVGNPTIVQTLPTNPRYICIACGFLDASHAFDHNYSDLGVEGHAESESLSRKHPKSAIVIVDSYTLTIVQTVFHGSLSIGPLKFMDLIRPFDDKRQQLVILVDHSGKIQLLPLLKDSDIDIEAVTRFQDHLSNLEILTSESKSRAGDFVVSVATSGHILVLIYGTHSMFLLMPTGRVIGRISYENSVLSGDDSSSSQFFWGMFLPGNSSNTTIVWEAQFAVWNDKGSLAVYEVSRKEDIFKYEVICEIPAVCYPPPVRLSVHFVWMNNLFLRVESICFCEEPPLSWKPHITIWSLSEQHRSTENYGLESRLLSEGDFVVDWIDRSIFMEKFDGAKHNLGKVTAVQDCATTSPNSCLPKVESDILCKDDSKYIITQKGRVVSSSMVISQNKHIPYGIVYGYQSGDIELVQFEAPKMDLGLDGGDSHYGYKKSFVGHTGAVLCLAMHKIVCPSSAQSSSHALLSGSMDCTVCIWDLENCCLIMVMHHHVAPVRQIILPPLQTEHPWSSCFLTIGEDSCVALASLESLHVERMFPGHPRYPSNVVWDSVRGYLACLCQNLSVTSGAKDVLYVWDIKSGARERVLRGTASQSMFDSFCRRTSTSSMSRTMYNHNTSSSCLCFPFLEDGDSSHIQEKSKNHSIYSTAENLTNPSKYRHNSVEGDSTKLHLKGTLPNDMDPIRCSSPFSGISVLRFDLSSLMSAGIIRKVGDSQQNGTSEPSFCRPGSTQDITKEVPPVGETLATASHNQDTALAVCLLQFSLSLLHLWGVDIELDNLLIGEMNLQKPDKFIVAPGLQGDRGAITLAFPGFTSALELWKASAEFCAMRSLAIVSLGQHMVTLSPSCSLASSALSAFYTRNFAVKLTHIKPSLQVLVSFWQDEDEHVRMAARSLFHCAASRAIPPPLSLERSVDIKSLVQVREGRTPHTNRQETSSSCLNGEGQSIVNGTSQYEDKEIIEWMESYELQDWISCVGGSSQDAMASHIIVAAALAIWYPSLVKPSLAMLAVHPLIKLVMAMNEKYSAAAAELLAEGMDNTWKACIGTEIHRLIGDIFFQIECVTGASVNTNPVGPVVPIKMRETLVGVLLPSLALADIPGFLAVIEGLIWSTASDSPAHLVSLKTLIRIMRGSPRSLAQHLQKVVNFILQTMDLSNPVMRKTCLHSSTAALKEVTLVYPMVALNDTSTRLAVGDAIAEMNRASIHVFDMQSVSKIKILDASGPPGLPTFLTGGDSDTAATAISALSFSPDGEGLVAFSENGLIIRWWSLGFAWWEKLSRNLAPVQCTKLIFVPPWEGFSPNSSRASIMASINGSGRQSSSKDKSREQSDLDCLNLLIHNLDLSYRLEWVGERLILLSRQGHEVGTFQLQA